MRLVSVSNLEVSEQLLTGESVPVSKTIRALDLDLPIGDRLNLCHASTIVTKGRGTGIVIGTGMNTQVCLTPSPFFWPAAPALNVFIKLFSS